MEEYTTEDLYNVAKFDITTFIDSSEVCLKGIFNYAVCLYKEKTIKNFIETYTSILKQIIGFANNEEFMEQARISDLTYLNIQKYRRILIDWNKTERVYPESKMIQELFEEQVKKAPDSIAIRFNNKYLTYEDLNKKANQLAGYIRSKYKNLTKEELIPDTLIGLYLNRGHEMIISILAVLKTGGAYLPIETNYPKNRIRYMLEDTMTRIVLTNERYKDKLADICKSVNRSRMNDTFVTKNNNCQEVTNNTLNKNNTKINGKLIEILVVNSKELEKRVLSKSSTNLESKGTSKNLAYVMYTSGTTGNPKGVMVTHTNIMRLIKNVNYIKINSRDIIAQISSASFDATTFEIWGAFLEGATLCIASNETSLKLDFLERFSGNQKITVIFLTTRLFDQLVLINSKIFSIVKHLIFGGEKLNPKIIEKASVIKKTNNLLHAYGPTETTTFATAYFIKPPVKKYDLPIGNPISNTKCYVLDKNLTPLPIGTVGELYIGGEGLSRGYLNNPSLTAEKFIPNPFRTTEEMESGRNSRLYKTGDLVRWLPDGNLEYIGRNDFQVKIRGYRIELGEIENVLSDYVGIKQSVVLARDHIDLSGELTGNKYLVGYYVPSKSISEEKLSKYLKTKLPEYMVPNVLMKLESLPLTPNGKLDRKALPLPEFTKSNNYVSPRNESEDKLSQIWSEVLGIEKGGIGINDDFFRLGGDSIISIQLVSKIRQKLGINIKIKDIFTYKTIDNLYDQVINKKMISQSKIVYKTEQGKLEGKLGLLPIQGWFFESNFTKRNHWNQSFLIRVPALDIERLEKSIEKLVLHHDVFRLRYKCKKSKDLSYLQYWGMSGIRAIFPIFVLDVNFS